MSLGNCTLLRDKVVYLETAGNLEANCNLYFFPNKLLVVMIV